MTNLDILHTEYFPELTKEAFTVDLEPEAFFIDERSAHPRKRDSCLAGGHNECVQSHRPLFHTRFHLAASTKSPLNKVRVDLRAQLLPDFFFGWTENLPQDAHDASI